MAPYAASFLALALGYLFGAIPFAYLIVLWRKGIDIRTVGSGNVGATNAGRLLGFRYFLLCFALDVAKGFLPTWGVPRLVAMGLGSVPSSLPVLIALATILGHNFPVYLGFRGGKGVATSLGALAALDPTASLAAAILFVISIIVTRFVSVSSVLGGIAFALVHFVREPEPWAREHLAMTVVVMGLLIMLIARHRANFQRIAAGTEPRVPLGRRSRDPDAPVSSPAGSEESRSNESRGTE